MIHAPPPPRLAWLIEQNARYAPLLDTGLKVATLFLPIGALAGWWLWSIFSGYLGWLGQPSLPLTQAGDWLFLLGFGAVVSLIGTALVLAPATWTTLVRWNAPAGTAPKTIRAACGACAVTTLAGSAAGILGWDDAPTPLAVIVPVALGGIAGGVVMLPGLNPRKAALLACLGFAAASLLTMLWFSSLWLLLAPSVDPFAKTWPITAALGLSLSLAVLLAIYIAKPPAGILVGLLVAGVWIAEAASPDGGAMIAGGLYTANLGGGRPAYVDQHQVATGEICNLGVDARAVLVFEPAGCERRPALKRLRFLRSLGRLDRMRVLATWRSQAETRLRGARR